MFTTKNYKALSYDAPSVLRSPLLSGNKTDLKHPVNGHPRPKPDILVVLENTSRNPRPADHFLNRKKQQIQLLLRNNDGAIVYKSYPFQVITLGEIMQVRINPGSNLSQAVICRAVKVPKIPQLKAGFTCLEFQPVYRAAAAKKSSDSKRLKILKTMAEEPRATERSDHRSVPSSDLYKSRLPESCCDEGFTSDAAPKTDPEFNMFFDRVMKSLHDRGFMFKNH